MKNSFIVLLMALWSLCLGSVHAQGVPLTTPGFEKEEMDIQRFKPQKSEFRKRINSLNKNEVLISFHEGFSDSILVYVQDSLYMHAAIKSDTLGSGYSVGSVKVNFKFYKKRRILITIMLCEKKKYISFLMSRKYKMIKVHRMEPVWYIIKTNYVPVYQ
jgi:hypothetical protein